MTRITANNLYKDFKIYDKPQDRLAELLLRKPKHKIYHVLSDISFAVPNGRSMGIIGDNGAGKSTLLKILSGIISATSGEVFINGKLLNTKGAIFK